ncbi:hypothetical protein ACGFZK_03745 [Streptomyces sp. NPDC048257]|uniref:hypothetical protein n=1 Tax=Streptomyces sp. NPDC048257 TaxID=3365526 RepID=UPI003721C832
MLGKKLGTALAALALATGGVAITATPAAAGTPCTVETTGWKDGGRQYVDVNNRCIGPVNVRVIWDWAHDSSCKTIASGTTLRFDPSVSFGRFNRTESC